MNGSLNSSPAKHNTNDSIRASVKFAGDEAKDKLYEPKHNQKAVRVLTVIAYVFSVSLAAIMLSTYYTFLWQNKPANTTQAFLNNTGVTGNHSTQIPEKHRIETPQSRTLNIILTTPMTETTTQDYEDEYPDNNSTTPFSLITGSS